MFHFCGPVHYNPEFKTKYVFEIHLENNICDIMWASIFYNKKRNKHELKTQTNIENQYEIGVGTFRLERPITSPFNNNNRRINPSWWTH